MSRISEPRDNRLGVVSRQLAIAGLVTWRGPHVAVGQGRGARVDRRQKGDTAMENERAISVGRSDTGDGVA